MFIGISIIPAIGVKVINQSAQLEPVNNDWIEQQKLLASDGTERDCFGVSVSINDEFAVIGAFFDDENGEESGSAYIFKYDGESWIEEAKLLPSDGEEGERFGISVSIYGDYALIGAALDNDLGKKSGSVYVFKNDGENWFEVDKLYASDGEEYDYFGVSISIDGDYVLIGAEGDEENGHDSGSAYVFKYDGDGWVEETKLIASDGTEGDRFGYSCSLNGDYALIGAWMDYDDKDDSGDEYGSGSAYVFKYDGDGWVEQTKLLASDGEEGDMFGTSVSMGDEFAFIGAWGNDDNGTRTGSAYVFKYDGDGWVEDAKLLASDGNVGDYFGYSVSIYGNIALVGAWGDEINGHDSGSAYVFKYDGDGWVEETKLIASDGDENDIFGSTVFLNVNFAFIGAYGDDDNGLSSGAVYVFKCPNQLPNPPAIDGPNSGKTGIIYDYDFNDCVDPDGDDMTYHVEWGDDGVDEGFVASGGAFTLSHKWDRKGDYQIKAKLIDDYGAESDWATFDVNIPRTKTLFNQPFQYLFSRFTNLSPILKIIKGFK